MATPLFSSRLHQPHQTQFLANIIHKTIFQIQHTPRRTQTISETHRKYHKIMVYQHPQLKLVFCLKRHTKTLKDTYVEVDIQTSRNHMDLEINSITVVQIF